MANQLVKVPFHGDELDAVERNGVIQVSLRRCCENLGLDFSAQLKKLRGKAWACVVEITTQMPGSDQNRELTMIDLETLPGWLFSIDARKVAEHVREKLARYQREAAKVLANHFLRAQTVQPGFVQVSAENLERLVGRMEHMQQQLDRLAAQPAVQLVAPAMPRFTVRQRIEWHGWQNPPKKARKNIQKMAAALIDQFCDEPVCQAGGTGGGGPTYFQGNQLTYLDEAIHCVRNRIIREEKEAEGRQPTLPFINDRPRKAS